MSDGAMAATMAVMKSRILLACVFLLLVSSADAQPAGRFGSGALFSAGSPVVRVPAATLSNAFTIEAWINPTTYGWTDFWRQLTDAQGSGIVFGMSMTRTGTIYFAFYSGANGYPIFTVPAVPRNRWTHIAVTYDGARIRIYFDATEVATRSAAGTLLQTSEPMEIGAGFPGRIDEVRVYSRALTPVEIALDRATPIDPLAPFQVAVTTPEDQSRGVATTPISATFSAAADPGTLTFGLRDPAGASVPATVTYDAGQRRATLVPAAPLVPLTDYVARVQLPALSADTTWTFRTAAADADPRVALAFSEGTGSAVVDSSGNGNTASLADATGWTAGMYGGGVAEEEILLPTTDSVSLSTAFTFEAWIRPSANGWGDLWVQNPNEGLVLYSLSISPAGTLYLAASLGTGWYPMFTSVAVPLNSWTHVAATYDGTRLRMYFDGVEVASRAAHGSLAATAQPIDIGRGFHGSIDEVRIYNRALTPNEIIADRQTTVDARSPLAVTVVTPGNGATGVVAIPVTATFSAAVDAATLNGAFELRNSAGALVPASVSYAAATRTATLMPGSALDPLAEYTARVSTGVHDTAGRQLAGDVAWTFRTAAAAGAPSLALAFSEGIGVLSGDWSGNGNLATLRQGAAWGSGQFGSGLSLSGAAGASVAASESIRLSTAFTFETWVNVPATGTQVLWFRAPDYQGGLPLYALQVVSGGALDFAAVLNDAYLPLRAPATIPPEVWTHVAATYDGSRMRLYLNGVESASRTAAGSLAISNEPMELGPRLAGALDEVRIYRRALAAAEIAADMAMPIDSRQSMISSIEPGAGPIGQAVAIAGVNFGSTQGTSVVTFNGAPAGVSAWADGAISAVVPPGATSGPVVVVRQGVPSNAKAFSVTGPQISAVLSPPPDGLGWNNSSVTVTFACTGADAPVSFCTSPRTIAFSGAGIRVTGQATDQNGVTATLVVILNVDLSGPAMNVYSPKATAVFPPGTATVALKGSAVDALSGAGSVICAGIPAALAGQNFTCQVAVHDGMNSIAVVATDLAGRTTTKNVPVLVADIAPASLEVSPASLTLPAGSSQPLAVFDDRGRPIIGGTWSTSNADSAAVLVEDGVSILYALAPGTATLTVTLGALSAQTVVTVIAADMTPPGGTTLWALTATPATPGVTPGGREVVRATPVAVPENPSVLQPSLFFVERGPYFQDHDTTFQPTVIRAVTAEGREAWRYTLPADTIFGGYSPVRQVVPDDRGGLLVLVSSSRPVCCHAMNETIRRLDGITGEVTWEYGHRETFGRFSEIALHPDGTIFVVEKLSNANSTELVAIDGSTGRPISWWDLTSRHTTYPNQATATSPLVQDDGSVVTVVSRWDNVTFPSASAKIVERATLHWTPPAAALSIDRIIRAEGGEVNLGVGDILAGPWPDGQGGLLVGNISSQSSSGFANLAHVSAGAMISPTVSLPFGTLSARDLQYVLSDNAAYVLVQYWEGSGAGGAKTYKLNPETLGILDVFDLAGGPYVQLTSAIDGGGTLYTSHLQGDAFPIGYGLLAGWVSNTPTVQTAVTTGTATTLWPFRRGTMGRREAPNPRLGIFLKTHSVSGVPGDPSLHSSLRLAPKNQARWAGATGLGFQQDAAGNWFVTIGGHPEPGPCSGYLMGLTNYFDDVDLSNKRYVSPLRYPPNDEEAIVTGLLLSNSHYQGHEVLYRCTPQADDPTYNSNSYAHGLMNKVGLPVPLEAWLLSFLQYGWYKPVPSTHFDPQP
jgi:hypothetical protein